MAQCKQEAPGEHGDILYCIEDAGHKGAHHFAGRVTGPLIERNPEPCYCDESLTGEAHFHP